MAFFTIFALIISLVALEALTRLVFPEPLGTEVLYANTYTLNFDEALGWRHNPGVVHEVRNTDGEVATYRMNSYGFRGDEPATRHVEVLFVGDSMTFGLNATTTFAEQFSIMSGRATINAGVRAYGTDQSFLMMRRAVDEMKFIPRYVVYGFYFNDLLNNVSNMNIHLQEHLRVHKPILNLDTNQYEPADYRGNDITRLIANPDALSLFRSLIWKSKFLRALSRVIKYDVIGYEDPKRQDPINKTSLEYLERNLDNFVEYTRAKGIRFVLLHIPSILEPALDEEAGAFLGRYAREKGIPYVRPELVRDDYLNRDLHLSAKGARRVAAALQDLVP